MLWSVKRPLCCIPAALLVCAVALIAAGCGGRHTHSGTLQALRAEAGGEIPCCGIFRCGDCGETYEKSVTYADARLPVIQITGSLEGISKENKVKVSLQYDGPVSYTGSATLKWQGGATLQYSKKNYSLSFIQADGAKNKVLLREEWGRQSKYCLKANWDDFGGVRNLTAAELWGEIVHDRRIGDRLDPLINGGAVDGIPVLLYLNGDYLGLYTLNTPKDKWIFGMTKNDPRAGLLFGEEWSDSVQLQEPIRDPDDPAADGWDVEYCATEDTAEGIGWLADGMNDLIGFLRQNSGDALKTGLGDYTDPDRCIDYLLYVFFICGADNTGRNILWATYDGRHYLPSAYDLDNTWQGSFRGPGKEIMAGWLDGNALRGNLLFDRLLEAYPEEIAARYAALRGTILSRDHVAQSFSARFDAIPAFVREAEKERWPSQSDVYNSDCESILRFFDERAASLDALFGVTAEETSSPAD